MTISRCIEVEISRIDPESIHTNLDTELNSSDWNTADKKLVFKPQMGVNYSFDLWAPEIHNIDNKWYVIFTADSDADSPLPETDMYCDYSCPAVNHR